MHFAELYCRSTSYIGYDVGNDMKKNILILITIITLAACGSAPISDADKALVKESKKSILYTNNREPKDWLYIFPIFIDMLGGTPTQIHIREIDGKEIGEWHSLNYEVALEPGKHYIYAACRVKLDDIIRDVDDKSGKEYQTTEHSFDYLFEGGKKYRMFAHEHLGGHCTIEIEATN